MGKKKVHIPVNFLSFIQVYNLEKIKPSSQDVSSM